MRPRWERTRAFALDDWVFVCGTSYTCGSCGRRLCPAEEFCGEWRVTTKTTAAAVAFAQENKGRFVEELKALLRIPSISTLPEHAKDVRRAAEFVAAELKRIGMENVHLIETTTPEEVIVDASGEARVVPARF